MKIYFSLKKTNDKIRNSVNDFFEERHTVRKFNLNTIYLFLPIGEGQDNKYKASMSAMSQKYKL